MKDRAIVYMDFAEAVEALPAEIQGKAYGAYMRYALYGEDYNAYCPAVAALVEAFREQIDEDNEDMEE